MSKVMLTLNLKVGKRQDGKKHKEVAPCLKCFATEWCIEVGYSLHWPELLIHVECWCRYRCPAVIVLCVTRFRCPGRGFHVGEPEKGHLHWSASQ
jgi:hypothetical protein